MFVAPHRGRAYIFADLIFYFYNGQYPVGAVAERWSLMRLSVKNERPLYNAYRGGIHRRSLSLSLPFSFLLSLSLSLFGSSIRNLISHESERRLSPSPLLFSRLFSLFLPFFCAKSKPTPSGNVLPAHELLFSRLPLNVDNVATENFSDELTCRHLISNAANE